MSCDAQAHALIEPPRLNSPTMFGKRARQSELKGPFADRAPKGYTVVDLKVLSASRQLNARITARCSVELDASTILICLLRRNAELVPFI